MINITRGFRASTAVIVALLIAVAGFLAISEPTNAASFTVTKTADTNDGTCDADCSLREAITVAEAALGVDTVVFDPAAFPEGAPATIAVGSALPTMSQTSIDGTGAGVVLDGAGAGLGVTGLNFNSGGALTGATVRNITIQNFSGGGINMNAGSDNAGAVIDGVIFENDNDSININAGANTTNASITDVTITSDLDEAITINAGGNNTGATISGTTINGAGDEAIDINAGGDTSNVTISGSTITGASDDGLQLNAVGPLSATVSDSTISGNGGGIDVNSSAAASLTVTDSTISGNTDTSDGAGIDVFAGVGGAVSITGSTISGNDATSSSSGGGISVDGSAITIVNSTIHGNTADSEGGGILCGFTTTLSLTNVTITSNTSQGADTGGGVLCSEFEALNTIIAGNIDAGGAAPDCGGTLNSLGHNLVQDTTGCTITGDTTGNITGQDPQLGALADNGGPTFTRAVSPGTPPYNAGTNTDCPATDQRGVARPQEGTCEIGAYEFQVITPSPSPAPGEPGTPTQAPAALPPTGGSAGGGTSQGWLLAVAVLGVAVVAGAGTFAVARRRE